MGFFSNRRNRIFDDAISSVIASGKRDIDFNNLYFDAAVRYGKDNGGKLYDDINDSIIFTKEINNNKFDVMFMKTFTGNGTNITVTEKENSNKIGINEDFDFINDLLFQGTGENGLLLKRAFLKSSEISGSIKVSGISSHTLEIFVERFSTFKESVFISLDQIIGAMNVIKIDETYYMSTMCMHKDTGNLYISTNALDNALNLTAEKTNNVHALCVNELQTLLQDSLRLGESDSSDPYVTFTDS